MKRRIFKKYKTKKKGGQHYRVNYGMGWGLKTTVPIVDYPEDYGYISEKKEISPDEFMKLAKKESERQDEIAESGRGMMAYDPESDVRKMSQKEYEELVIYKPSIGKIKEGLKSKEPLVPPGYIEFGKEGEPIAHEGRHRAIAAREIGMKKIPVFFLKKKND